MVFFTSYTNLEECFQQWKSSNIDFHDAPIFKEEKDNKLLVKTFKNYSDAISKGNSALLLCTCRGKLSEGLNFKDNLARACFVIGIPYMHLANSRVILKR